MTAKSSRIHRGQVEARVNTILTLNPTAFNEECYDLFQDVALYYAPPNIVDQLVRLYEEDPLEGFRDSSPLGQRDAKVQRETTPDGPGAELHDMWQALRQGLDGPTNLKSSRRRRTP